MTYPLSRDDQDYSDGQMCAEDDMGDGIYDPDEVDADASLPQRYKDGYRDMGKAT